MKMTTMRTLFGKRGIRKNKIKSGFSPRLEPLEQRAMLTVTFTPGDLAVVRIGGTTGDPSQQSNPALTTANPASIWVDEYTPAGVWVQSVPMPTSGLTPLTASGTDFTGDNVTRTADGQNLLVTGYDAPIVIDSGTGLPEATGNPSNASALTVPRVIGLVDRNGNVNASTELTDFENGTSSATATIRSAASQNGTSFYVLGANDTNSGQTASGGLHYVASLGATTSTNLSQNVGGNDNMRQVQVINGNLFMTSGATVPGRDVFEVGTTGLPTTQATASYNPLFTALPNTSAENYNAFQFFDLSATNGDPRVAGADTLYITNSGSGGTGPSLDKYSYSDATGKWTEVSSTSYGGNPSGVGSLYGLTGYNTGAGVQLYMTTTQGGSGRSQIVTLTDTSGYAAANTGSFNVLADIDNPGGSFPSANTAFKGIQYVPSLAPVVTTDSGSASFTEGGFAFVDAGLTLSDPDAVANDISGATVQITGNYTPGEDSLSFTIPNGSGITGFWSPDAGQLVLTGTSSIANYQSALQSVKYVDSSQNPTTATRTLSFTVTDVSMVPSTVATRGVTVTAVNTPPTIGVPAGQTIGINEGLTFSSANSNAITVADVDANGGAEQLALSVNAGQLFLSTTSGLTGSGNGTSSLTYSGTLAALSTALNGLTFVAPASPQAVTLNASLNDQGNTGTGGPQTTNSSPVTITVTNHQDAAPVITTTGTALSYAENAGALNVDPAVTVTDSDNFNLVGASVSITAGFEATQDALGFSNQNGISGSYSASTGVLTLTGSSSVANYQAALRSVTYTDSSHDPTASRTVTFAASDGVINSTATRNITIVAFNDPPVNTVPGVQSVATNGTHVFSAGVGNQISIADVDANGALEQVTLSVTAGTVSLNGTAGLSFSFSDGNGTGSGTGTHDSSATFRGTIASINAALNGLTFNAPATAASVTLTLATDDLGNTGSGGPQTTTSTVPITVAAPAPLVIQQILWNPPGTDVPNQYVEIRAIPGLNGSSYAGGVYTIPAGTYIEAIEGDGGPGPNPGSVNDIFDVGGFQTGSDGVLILLQQQNYYKASGFYDVTDPNANVIAEVSAPGFGNDADPVAPPNDSEVHHSAATFATGGNIEDPSASWFLYQTSVAPTINDDIDASNNGTPGGPLYNNWVIDDSIGVLDESADITDYSYAKTTFVDTHGFGQAQPGTTVIPIDFTAAFVSRTNSTNGTGATDWLASTLNGVNPPPSAQPAQFTLDNLHTSLSGYDNLPLDTWNAGTLTAGVTLGSVPAFGNTYVTPVIDINGAATDGRDFLATFNQGGGPVNVGNSTGLVVVNYGNSGDMLTSATVQISNQADGASETLAANTTGTPITANYNSANGTLTLTGNGTLAQYQQVLRTVSYNDTAASPSLTPRKIVFTTTDGTYTSAPSTTTVGMFASLYPTLRINELDVNPPGNDNPYEYIEIEGPAGMALGNFYLASVEGDDVDPNTTTQPSLIGNTGRATYVANLSSFSIGSDGLLIIKSPDAGFTVPVGTTVDGDPLFDNAGGTLQNGTNSFLLVYSPNTPITAYTYDPTTGAVINVGTDFDTSGAGTARDNGTLTMPSGSKLIDNVAWFDGDNTYDLAYGSVVLPLETGAPTAATRIPGDYSQSVGAWYYGQLNATSNASISYNNGNIGPLPASSSNLPAGAVLTPGAANFSPAGTPAVLLNNPTANYSTTFTNAAPVAITGSGQASITDTEATTLVSLTASLASPQVGDVLIDSVSGTSITSSYNAGTGVLTLSGSDTLAHYQQVLGTVKYNNTTGTPNILAETVNVVATDSLHSSTAAVATINISVTEPISSVSAVKLFYDNSKFNKNVEGVATGTNDDKAIDTTKTAYLPGAGTANFSNISAYTDGINGIMVDLATGGAHGNLNASDFTFRVGLNNTPSKWATAPAPSTISVRSGSPAAGNDRVELTWTDGSITQEFLEVTVHADPNTGLSAPYTFFYGSVIANSATGDTGSLAITSSTDENAARSHGGTATVSNVFDYNKDGFVNSSDENAARGSGTSIKFIKIAANTPLAPDASPSVAPDLSVAPAVTPAATPSGLSLGPASGIASGLSSLLNNLKTEKPLSLRLDWLSSELKNVNLNSGLAATIFEALGAADTKLTRSILTDADKVADQLGLDDTLLDSILVDLGLE